MDFTQMMTLLIVSQRHFMHGPSNVYRVIWDCIGVILTPCSLFYLTDICQTLIDKFDRCQGLKRSENRGAPARARRSGYLTFCLCFFCTVFLINIILYHLLVYIIPYPVLAILTEGTSSVLVRVKFVISFWSCALNLAVPIPVTGVAVPAVVMVVLCGLKSVNSDGLFDICEVQPLSTIQSNLGSISASSPLAAMSTVWVCVLGNNWEEVGATWGAKSKSSIVLKSCCSPTSAISATTIHSGVTSMGAQKLRVQSKSCISCDCSVHPPNMSISTPPFRAPESWRHPISKLQHKAALWLPVSMLVFSLEQMVAPASQALAMWRQETRLHCPPNP